MRYIGCDATLAMLDHISTEIANIPYLNSILPIRCSYDRDYLLKAYKKMGVIILRYDNFLYYKVILPDGFFVTKDETGYCVKNENEVTFIHYFETKFGSIIKNVSVDKIYFNFDN